MFAKEMFEKLGYKQQITKYCINYQNGNSHIYFRNDDKSVDLSTNNKNKILTLNQLKAVIKQAEELGWFEEGCK